MKKSPKQYLSYLVIALILTTSCTKVKTTYYSNNTISSVVTMKHNKKNGRARYYFTNGALQQETYFKDDKAHGLLRRWKTNGILLSEEHYTDGLKNGIATIWDEQGHKVSQLTYCNDTLDGQAREWYETGSLRLEGNYRHGMFDGRWIWMSQEGKVVGEGNFIGGKGVVKSFFINSKPSAITHYTNNEKDGQEIVWDESGKIKFERQWQMGKIIVPDSTGKQDLQPHSNAK